MIARLKTGLLTAAAVLLVLAGAYGAGSRAAELQQARARIQSTRKAREIKQTIDAVHTDTVRHRARNWVRPPDGRR